MMMISARLEDWSALMWKSERKLNYSNVITMQIPLPTPEEASLSPRWWNKLRSHARDRVGKSINSNLTLLVPCLVANINQFICAEKEGWNSSTMNSNLRWTISWNYKKLHNPVETHKDPNRLKSLGQERRIVHVTNEKKKTEISSLTMREVAINLISRKLCKEASGALIKMKNVVKLCKAIVRCNFYLPCSFFFFGKE